VKAPERFLLPGLEADAAAVHNCAVRC
jgi:hypothetical protein